MMQRLEARTAFINGGASGIGRASALRLAAEGASVWITGRDAATLDEALAEAGRAGLTLRALQIDSADAHALGEAIDAVQAADGRLDILVNNAGGSLQTPYQFEQESDDDWHRVLEVNVMSSVRACRKAIPHMRAGGGGRIVNVGSKAGRFGSLNPQAPACQCETENPCETVWRSQRESHHAQDSPRRSLLHGMARLAARRPTDRRPEGP